MNQKTIKKRQSIPSVLLVEDNPGDAELIKIKSEEESGRPLHIVFAESLKEAKDALDAQKIDLILLDLGLPESSGYDTFMKTKRLAPDTPIIVLTGQRDYQLAESCIRSGAQDYLVKGKIEGYINGVIYNAVLRWEIQRALGESYINLQHMLADSEDSIVVTDGEAQVKFANQSAQRLFGSSVLAGSEFQLSYDGNGQSEFVIKNEDSTETVVDMNKSDTIWYGMPAKVYSFRDISERFKNQQELQKRRERAKRYLEVAAVMMLGLDEDGRIKIINKRGCEIMEVAKSSELIGHKWLDYILDVEKENVETILREIFAGDIKRNTRIENHIVTAKGNIRKILWHNAVVQDEEGRVTGTLSSGEDVTELRKMEVQLAQADRLTSMGMLAAGVAHEINNPLTYILYNLETLEEEFPLFGEALHYCHGKMKNQIGNETFASIMSEQEDTLSPTWIEDMQGLVGSAAAGARKVREIVKDLKLFSRVEDDSVYQISVEPSLNSAINLAYNEIKYRATLVKDYQNPPLVKANEGRLSQVFLNLLVNAAHSIDEGDVDNNFIRIKTYLDNGFTCIQIEDTGAGIPNRNVSHLFEPFFTTKPSGVGSGLGLSICHKIVTSYGGTIEVSTELNQGSIFVIKLPMGKPDTVSVPVTTSATKTTTSSMGGNILLIDDELGVHKVVESILSKQYNLVATLEAQEAKEMIEKNQELDLILCDIMMPHISGIDFHEWLVASYPTLAPKCVFITGGVFTDRSKEYLENIDAPQIEKPFDVPAFRELIAQQILIARQHVESEVNDETAN